MIIRVPLKGIHRVTSKGKTYDYAWRGGPPLRGKRGSPEYVASFNEAHEGRRTPDKSRFRSVVVFYKASGSYSGLAESTRRKWGPWLDRIAEDFGSLRIAQFDRPEKIRPVIRRWRHKWEGTPRTADYALQVLSRVLSYAVDPLGLIASNPCEGIKYLYTVDRSEIIWTDADIAHLKLTCSVEIAHATDLAAHTGLRLGDVVRLAWSHVGEDAIVIPTNKTGKTAFIPLYDDLRAVLAGIPKRSPTILTNSKRRPWTANSLTYAFSMATLTAGLRERKLHFHDLRGTAATKFYLARLPVRVIAEIMAWDEESVERIIRRYVDRSAATRAIIRQLNEGNEK